MRIIFEKLFCNCRFLFSISWNSHEKTAILRLKWSLYYQYVMYYWPYHFFVKTPDSDRFFIGKNENCSAFSVCNFRFSGYLY